MSSLSNLLAGLFGLVSVVCLSICCKKIFSYFGNNPTELEKRRLRNKTLNKTPNKTPNKTQNNNK